MPRRSSATIPSAAAVRFAYAYGMRRITVTIPDELALVAEREAARRRTSISAVVRDAVSAQLVPSGDGPRVIPFAALGGSGHRTGARDMEEILAAEWTSVRGR